MKRNYFFSALHSAGIDMQFTSIYQISPEELIISGF
jgi:hypothetical protein